MKKIGILATLFSAMFLVSFTTPRDTARRVPTAFRVAFWNVENLFDTVNDTLTADEDFTPMGKLAWTEERYQKKLENIAKTLTSLPETRILPFVGLCEIENEKVLQDLLAQPAFQNKGYTYIHKNSPDERGIDVALIYRDAFFKISDQQWLTVDLTGVTIKADHTRDILYVKGTLMGDNLHVFVNHWPSRREGDKESEPKRMKAAEVLKAKLDSIKSAEPTAKIIVMGDFNDAPSDKSLQALDEVYKAQKAISGNQLYNPMYELEKSNKGTLYHNGEFNTFDQILVSGALVNPESPKFRSEDELGKIFAPDWMCFIDPKSKQQRPNRTFAGTKYYGGYSDHFPVYYDLKLEF